MTVTTSSGLEVHALLTDGSHLIGPDWVPAVSGETIDVTNPATQEILLRVPRGGAADLDAAVQAAPPPVPSRRATRPPGRGTLT